MHGERERAREREKERAKVCINNGQLCLPKPPRAEHTDRQDQLLHFKKLSVMKSEDQDQISEVCNFIPTD